MVACRNSPSDVRVSFTLLSGRSMRPIPETQRACVNKGLGKRSLLGANAQENDALCHCDCERRQRTSARSGRISEKSLMHRRVIIAILIPYLTRESASASGDSSYRIDKLDICNEWLECCTFCKRTEKCLRTALGSCIER